MRAAAIVILLLPSFLVFVPTASADCFTTQPSDTAGFYVVRGGYTEPDTIVGAHAGDKGTSVGVSNCWWAHQHVELWQENNGAPGLQTDGPGCVADTFVGEVTVASSRPTCTL